MRMFEQKFNPEFHWQVEKKEQNNKKYLLLLLILSAVFVLLFIFFKSYFISDKNIILEELIPDNAQATLSISNFQKFVGSHQDSRFLKSINGEIENYFEADINFTDQVDRGFYWAEFSADSQIIILGVDKFNLKSFLKDSNVNFEVEDEQIYKLSKNSVADEVNLESENKFLSVSKGNIYLSQPNNYILIISNDLNKIKDSQNKYKNSRRWNYWRSLKDDFNRYFKNKSDLELKVNNYDLIAESNSFLNNLSFLVENLQNKSFIIKIAVGSKNTDVYIGNNSNINDRFSADNYINDFYQNLPQDFVLFYDLEFNDRNFILPAEIKGLLKNNIENIYNIDIINSLKRVDNGNLLLFKDNKFLISSPEKQVLGDIYKQILAFSSPSTRTVYFPDQSRATEYYLNPNLVELREIQDGNISWFYADQANNMGFELVKCNNQYVFSNSKDKIMDYCNNTYSLVRERGYSELLLFDVSKIDNHNKFLSLMGLDEFTRNYKHIDLINFSNNGHIELFFKFRH